MLCLKPALHWQLCGNCKASSIVSTTQICGAARDQVPSTPASIDIQHVLRAAGCRSAVGSWSGYLFGLVQDFAKGDDAVDGLALAYADEQRVTNTTGHVTQLILQVKVGPVVLQAHCADDCAGVKLQIQQLMSVNDNVQLHCEAIIVI